MYHFHVNKILMLVGIAIAVVAVWLLLDRDSPASPAAIGTGSASAGSNTARTPALPTPVAKVGRVAPEERQRLADQIAKAKAHRAAGGGTAASSSVAGPRPELVAESDATLVRTTMREAMREIIPYLADCYDKAGDKVPARVKVVANMTLTGDPDIGTIIDTHGLADGDGSALEPSFDLCLKDAFVTLQMPPLSEGGEVTVTYPFVFSRNGPDEPAGSGNLPP